MTFSARVWGDVLRRLRNDIPDFAFEAWISPLEVKVSDAADRLLLGCPTSFHRERILRHHLPAIETAVRAAAAEASIASAPKLEVVSVTELAEAEGVRLEVRAGMRRVAIADIEQARVANGPDAGVGGATPHDSTPHDSTPHDSTPHDSRRAQALTRSLPQIDPSAPVDPRSSSPDSPKTARVVSIPGPTSHKHEAGRAAGGRSSEKRVDRGPDSRPEFGLDGHPRERVAPPFSFARFVVGPCNALAREAALAMARRRQQSLNLLYLAAASGMGKTHLARATAEEARRQLPPNRFDRDGTRRLPGGPAGSDSETEAATRGRIVYTTAERFTTDFVSAMRKGQNDAWTRRYRGPIELLVVEDVQFLSGRTKTQQELFHTLAHVLDAGGRVVLTGDRAPRELTGLDERLRAVVARGFIAELDRPDAIVRRHLFRDKAAAAGVNLPGECLDLLVDATEDESLAASVIDLESLLVQVIMTASLEHRSIDTRLCREAIALKAGASVVEADRRVEVHEIVGTVAGFFGARSEALASRSRRRDVLIPRQLAMYLAHRYTDASLTEIGRALGRDHPSVKNAIKKIEEQVLKNAPLRYQVEALSERIDALRDAQD